MENNLQCLLEQMSDGLYFTDPDRRITYWNKAAERISGYSAEEVVGSKCSDNILVHVDEAGTSLCLKKCPLAATMEDGTVREATVFLHHKQGHRLPVRVRVVQMRNTKGEITGGAEIFTDATNDKCIESRIKELEELVLIDSLTKLSNRRHVETELERLFHERMRHQLSFGVLFLDLDHFKEVNDTYGHNGGDKVLNTVGSTLKSCARPYDLFGRWGGEEFVGLIRNIDKDALSLVGERIRLLVENTQIHLPENTLHVTTSIGATLALPEDDKDSIIARADKNMYLSKENGRNRLTMG